MSLRIGFDMDGVLADFAAVYRAVEARVYGPTRQGRIDNPEDIAEEEEEGKARRKGGSRRRSDAIWAQIRQTSDFWQTLPPLDPDAVRRIHAMTLRHRWETFFITQRPATEGATVQRQTQRWLVEQGFDLPSVLVIEGSRGAAAGALKLDYHVDDSPNNCVDIKSDSSARPILIVEDDDLIGIGNARRIGIGTANSIGAALDILDKASDAHARPGVLKQLAQLVGWK